YAQYKVMELAAQNKTRVLLDGQGADETLAGYHKYLHWYLQELVRQSRFSEVNTARKQFSKNGMSVQWGIKNIVAAYLPAHTAITLEKREHSYITANPDVSRKLLQHIKGREWDGIHKPIVNKLNDMLYFNTMEFGLEEMLRYADRSSMAHGVEVRLPFLNAALVQFIFSCPTNFKIRDGFTKWILRKSMEDSLPPELVWRTDKVGYEPPQKQWMEHPVLVDYMQEAKKKLVKHDLLKPQVLQRKSDPKHAHERNNYEWRYLCTAQLLG
ncbi:MAG: asparagine synthase, partial [Pedobacter sp.]